MIEPLNYDDLSEDEQKKLDKGIIYDTTILMQYHDIKKVTIEKKIGEYKATLQVEHDPS